MSDGQVKNTVQGYISFDAQCYLATGHVNIVINILGVLVQRRSEQLKIFSPLYNHKDMSEQ